MYKMNVSQIERKEKDTSNPHYIPQKSTLPLTKWSYINSPPKYDYSDIQNYSLFLSWMTKGKSLRSSQLIITGRASILISNSINITTKVTTIVLVLRCLGRRRRRLYEATKASLSSSNMTDMGVHLIQLSSECIKASIHALKLRHDRIKSHTSRRRRGSKDGQSWRSGRSCRPGPPRM